MQKVSKVSFQWRSAGEPAVKNEEHEGKRNGDDAVFKLALLLRADETLFNPLIPSWMKRVDKLLSLPSEKVIYFSRWSEACGGGSTGSILIMIE